MNPPVEIVPTDPRPRSRRALLVGALGGLGAWAATAIGRPPGALAAAGDNLVIGEANSSGPAQTILSTYALGASFTLLTTNESTGATGIFGWASSGGPNRTRGVYGRTDSPAGYGVEGRSNAATNGSGAAIHALGGQNNGVDAITGNNFAYAVNGLNTTTGSNLNEGVAVRGEGHVGVQGVATGNSGVGVHGRATGAATTGVYGEGRVYGVYGEGTLGGGSGVAGVANATSGPGGPSSGVLGQTESTTGMGVRAVSSAQTGVNYGIHASNQSPAGFAGYFEGRVFTTTYYELTEIADPAAPSTNRARLFAHDLGGKTQICVRFPTGAVQALAIEP